MRLGLQNVSKSFGSRRVLDGLSMEVPEGGFFVLIGPTGCGKTTALRMADLLIGPDSGSVTIDGIEAPGSGRAATALRRRMSLVMQRPFMLAGSVRRNTEYGLAVRGLRPDRANTEAMLEAVGLAGYGDREANTLSGGELQKAALARSLLPGPELLLLDEPMSSVDPEARPGLRALLRRLHSGLGITIVMATHDFTDALALGTCGAVLMDGRISQAGTLDDIFHRPATLEIARFVGQVNVLSAVFSGLDASCGGLRIRIAEPVPVRKGFVAIPPEAISISLEPVEGSQRNVIPAVVMSLEDTGWTCLVELELSCCRLTARITRESAADLGLVGGKSVYASFKATQVRVLQ